MKKVFVVICLIWFAGVVHASEMSETFDKKYNDLTPKGNTSVRSDYLFEQIALGSEFTIKMLDQINSQQIDNNAKMDLLLQKLDTLIEQNRQLIKLLQKQANPSEKK